MANNTISQIKIGSTTYDICDTALRSKIWKWEIIERAVTAAITVPGQTIAEFHWETTNIPSGSDYEYWGYVNYNMDDIHITPVTINMVGMAITNHVTTSKTVTPTATQLWAHYSALVT